MKGNAKALSASTFLLVVGIAHAACSQSSNELMDEEPGYKILPTEVVEAIEELGVDRPFVLLAVDFNGDLIELVPEGVARNNAQVSLDGVDLDKTTLDDVSLLGVVVDTLSPDRLKVDGMPAENVRKPRIVFAFRYEDNSKAGKCRWPSQGGDPACKSYSQ